MEGIIVSLMQRVLRMIILRRRRRLVVTLRRRRNILRLVRREVRRISLVSITMVVRLMMVTKMLWRLIITIVLM